MKVRVAFNDQGRHTIYYGIGLRTDEDHDAP
jgi:hypothetical protein